MWDDDSFKKGFKVGTILFLAPIVIVPVIVILAFIFQ